MEGFESKTKETMVSLSLDSPPIKFRKEMMQKYLHKVLSATWDFSFLRYIDWVAKIHSDTPEKKTTVKIEYIHIVAFFGYLSGILTDAICRISELDEETKANTITAFNKFLYIQNDLFTKYCINEDYENEQLLETSFESKKKEALGVATQTRREFIPYLVSFAVGGLVLGFVTARVFNSK
ncbi:hypothetical protein AX774_g1932 [Zancudomyces culisetae]|uniref:Globin-sensor domain-containing protein n=1 Tax=Zancudomyces culisetae TaxID=1213189 RepID=A0A1R1PNY0_ZANCU|nr:hypothetical protein AX774_g7202 [Zancudomyces culisetae]OMH82685.1 hypothetical protein AX774_g3838 [Zancudomyces culisetae]OMH84527.1 hypothetical protein AX774_g1932 [Zancudomyces culisetae]|eukprot:OMH79390.1 hypothetical protein AX774_g7202 [Zancudomyces culisetae]